MDITNQSTENESKGLKKSLPKKISTLKKLDPETAKVLQQIKDRANKKNFGRKVKDSEILTFALRLLGPQHIGELQEATYSEQDRLHIAHEEFTKTNGKIGLDQYIGKLMRGEITATLRGNNIQGSEKD